MAKLTCLGELFIFPTDVRKFKDRMLHSQTKKSDIHWYLIQTKIKSKLRKASHHSIQGSTIAYFFIDLKFILCLPVQAMLWDYVYNTLNSFSCREEKVSSVVWTHIRYGTLHNFKPLGQNEFIVCKTDTSFFFFHSRPVHCEARTLRATNLRQCLATWKNDFEGNKN